MSTQPAPAPSTANNNADNNEAKHYDLVIIGTGSANSIPDENFANKSIAIIEKGRFGGTCLNVGLSLIHI